MAQSANELKIIHTRSLATPGRKYYGDDDKVYIGTSEGRLRLLADSNIVVFKPTEDISSSNVQSAIEEIDADSGATAGTYGDANNIPEITVDAKGKITSITTVAITTPLDEVINKSCTFDGQGGVITVNSTTTFEVDFTGTIIGWTLLETSNTPVASSIVLDAWKDTYANYPPTVADTIFGTKPSLTAATKNQSGVLAISVTSGDIIKVNVDSVTSAIKVKLIFHLIRTA